MKNILNALWIALLSSPNFTLFSTIISVQVLSKGSQKVIIYGDVHQTWDRQTTIAQAQALAKECIKLSRIVLFEGSFPDPFVLKSAHQKNSRSMIGSETEPDFLDLLEQYTAHYPSAHNIETRGNGPTEDNIALFAYAIAAHSAGMLDMHDPETAEWVALTRTHRYTLYMLNRHHWRVIQLLKKNLRAQKNSALKKVAADKINQLSNRIRTIYEELHTRLESQYHISHARISELLALPPAAVWDLPTLEQRVYAEFAHTVATSVSFTFEALDINALLTIAPTGTTVIAVGDGHAQSIAEHLKKLGFSKKLVAPVQLTNGTEYSSFDEAYDSYIKESPESPLLTIPTQPITIQQLRTTIYYAPAETDFCKTMLRAITPAQIYAALH